MLLKLAMCKKFEAFDRGFVTNFIYLTKSENPVSLMHENTHKLKTGKRNEYTLGQIKYMR